MAAITIFSHNAFGQVRTLMRDGEPWFIAADVCRALEISNSRDAVARLDDDERNTVALTDGTPGNPNMTIVSEPGLYALVLGSRKPEARAFKRWVTHEIIPAIRRTGGYIAGEGSMTDDELMARALLMANEKIRQRDERINHLATDNSRLEVENQRLLPKAEYFDDLVDRNLLTNFRETAKELDIPERTFIDFLLTKKYIFRDKKGRLLPMAGKGDGLFEVKECVNEKSGWAGVQTLITPRGRETFRLLTQGLKR